MTQDPLVIDGSQGEGGGHRGTPCLPIARQRPRGRDKHPWIHLELSGEILVMNLPKFERTKVFTVGGIISPFATNTSSIKDKQYENAVLVQKCP